MQPATDAHALIHLHRLRQEELATLHRAPPPPTDATRTLLRAEGLAALAAALALYAALDGSWWVFALLFLAPDLAMLGYLAGPRVGATIYNVAHSYVGPAVLGLAGVLAAPSLVGVAAIWAAHIGFDRALGYGLKRPSGFSDTHLGRIGRAAPPSTLPGAP